MKPIESDMIWIDKRQVTSYQKTIRALQLQVYQLELIIKDLKEKTK